MSKKLNAPASTLNTWRRRGRVHGRLWLGKWLYWANGRELQRLAALRSHPRTALTQVPSELRTPTRQPAWPADSSQGESL
ncbi:MAG: hypothetical protein B7Z73_08930 [Planctomycetia bacterium 21-64-5]|nr:MAG: hypothetical protein B7Z73_08930 [Planctomycetia bacterium 21-64-5]